MNPPQPAPSPASPPTRPATAGAALKDTAATASNMAPGSRKSRPLRRKTSHSVIERRRREKINEGLIHLQQTVPACRQELRELLDCKVTMNKKNAKRDAEDLQDEVDRMLQDKIATQMVLEKLCIISHTVDYVQELQEKVEAYRRLCRCSPPLAANVTNSSDAHMQAHMECEGMTMGEEEGVITPPLSNSDEGADTAAMACQSCATGSRGGKRHWGSNKPLQLSRIPAPKRAEGGGDQGEIGGGGAEYGPSLAMQRRPKRKAAPQLLREDSDSAKGNDSDGDSDLELEDWHEEETHVCPSQLYTNARTSQDHPLIRTTTSRKRRATLDSIPSSTTVVCHHPSSHDRLDARLGLLADVSAETSRAESSASPTLEESKKRT